MFRRPRFLAMLALTALLSSCSGVEYRDPMPQDFPVHGIDVSRWQAEINWHEVRRDGVEFAFIKATEGGDFIDPMFVTNWYAAKEAGVPRGAYHFYYFCRPVEEQIAWFIQNVPRDPQALPPVLDMEWNHISKNCPKPPPADKIAADVGVFLDAVEAHYGKRPIVYTTIDFHRDVLVGKYTAHDFWLRSVASHPSYKYDRRDNWVFWQYTAQGTIKGIKGPVDRNVFFGTRSQWQQWLRGELRRK
nr:GH25 family lysozyme [Pannonibacter phragmitetus]